MVELLTMRKPIEFRKYLINLSMDEHPYVRKRALNYIEEF